MPQLKLLAPGDLFIWAVPNAGNPQKVQRYVGEWAAGLREMAALDAELLVPGHGFPIFGADRIRQALSDTAELLESIEGQVLALMNTGASLDRVLHEVEIPTEALEKPYLRPVYDHPQFLVRNVWRLYGGWYDGEPDELLPAPRAEQAAEWTRLAGGVEALLARAAELRDAGDLRLACHIVEMAVRAEPDSPAAHELRAENLHSARSARGLLDGPWHLRVHGGLERGWPAGSLLGLNLPADRRVLPRQFGSASRWTDVGTHCGKKMCPPSQPSPNAALTRIRRAHACGGNSTLTGSSPTATSAT